MTEAMLELHVQTATLVHEARHGSEPTRQVYLTAQRWDDHTSTTGGPGELYETFEVVVGPQLPAQGEDCYGEVCYGEVCSEVSEGRLLHFAELYLPEGWFQDVVLMALAFDREKTGIVLNMTLQGVEARGFDMRYFDKSGRRVLVSGVQTIREGWKRQYGEPAEAYLRERQEAVAKAIAEEEIRARRAELTLV